MTDESIFAAALAIPTPGDRAAYLERACAGNSALRKEVEALLAAHATDNPLDRPPADLARTGAYEPAGTGDAVGTTIVGRYKLLELLGEGGMGSVYMAQQIEPVKRLVAVKVIRDGMDSRQVLARFEAERQALALMDHPNIAKVLDAGATDEGRPYFVMELVKGVPITKFCDDRKLTPRQRLELFVPVCQAIQHAHQKGVIHRDLKPTNVLVALYDGKPVPKVIDFGVAKAAGQPLTDRTLVTGFGAIVGTPEYMSPEQAELNQLDIDTRSDVYALGVLLYELLTGTTPLDRKRLGRAVLLEILRIVREEEPPKPSTRISTSDALAGIAADRNTNPTRLSRLVRGELDWIVMKALEKDRNRRYDSANAFARDVERFLAGDAVEACPPTLGYRIRKAYRRHRGAVLTACAFVAVLLAATGVSAWLAVRATDAETGEKAQRVEAEKNLGLAEIETDKAIRSQNEAVKSRNEANDALAKLRDAQEKQQDDQYVWDLQLLPLAFEANNVVEVRRLLDRHVPAAGQRDRRGFEWFFWDRKLHTDLRTDRLPDAGEPRGFTAWVGSPDGSRVARFTAPAGGHGEAEEPPTLTVWDVATRKVLLKHRMAIEKPVNQSYSSLTPKAPQFSPDGKRVAVEWGFLAPQMPQDGQYLRQVLDVASGKALLNLEGAQGGLDVVARGQGNAAFSPDGRRFAAVRRIGMPQGGAAPPAEIRVWELESGKEVCAPLSAGVLADPPFSPDGTLLVVQNRQARTTRVSVWDLAGGKESAGWDLPEATVHSLTLGPDGKRVAGVVAGLAVPTRRKGENPPIEPQVKVWDATGKELCSFSPPGLKNSRTSATRVFFSPDGARLAVVERPADPVPTGTTLGDLTIWEAATGRPLPPLAGFEIHSWTFGAGSGSGPIFSPDGKQIVNVGSNVLRTWDVETGKAVLTLRGHVHPIAARGFTPDGKRLWSVEFDGLLKLWDARPGQVEVRFVAPSTSGGGGIGSWSASELAVSPDGSRVASLIEVRTDPALTAPRLAAVRVWDTNGKSVQILHPPPRDGDGTRPPVNSLALSRDGRRAVLARYVSGFVAGTGFEQAPPADVIVWDVESKAVLLHKQLGRRHAPHVAISPDGKTVAVVSRTALDEPPGVWLLDVDGKRERTPLSAGELSGISSITFSPDGRRLAGFCMSLDAAARKTSAKIVVWDVENGSQVSAFEMFGGRPTQAGFTTAIRIAWAPDGSRFIFSPDSGRNAELAVHDVTGEKVLTLEEPVSAAGTSGVQYVAYSPDGKRIAALQMPRSVGGVPALKVWDAATGRELLSLRIKTNGETSGGKSLTFTGDGHRVQLTELVAERRPPEQGGGVTSVRTLSVTTWDATPVPRGEPKKP